MKDQISALMDDELDTATSSHLFAALNADDKLSECWALYHAIGDSMRGDPQFTPDFQKRLMRRLAQEPTVLAPRKPSYKPSFMLSAAASVAAVLFVGWMVLQQQAQSIPAAPSLAQNNVSAESVQSYLLAHHEQSPENVMQTAYMRPVAYSGSGE